MEEEGGTEASCGARVQRRVINTYPFLTLVGCGWGVAWASCGEDRPAGLGWRDGWCDLTF